MKIFLGYHGGCLDGTISAYLMVTLLKDNNELTVKPYPRQEALDLRYDRYVFVDITPEREQLILLPVTKHVLIIDHHGIDYELPPNVEYIHSAVNKCASMLVFEKYFQYYRHYPYLILLINKQDLGPIGNLNETEQSVYYYYEQYINHPELLKRIMDNPSLEIISEGNTIRRHIARQVERIMKSGYSSMRYAPLDKPVHMYNTSILLNEISSKDIFPIVCGYYTSGNMIMLNIRSLDESSLDIARELGGGGHPNSAGARISIEKFYDNFTFD